MNAPARTVFAFGVYLIIVGFLFILLTSSFISFLHLPPLSDPWTRVVGTLVAVVGSYYVLCARANAMAFVRASVIVRFGFAAATVLLFLFGGMPAGVLGFGIVDLLGAIWTTKKL